MAELGTYYITIMPSMNKFTSAVKSELGGLGKEAGGTFNTSFMDVLKGSAIGTMVGNLGTALGNEIMSGLSTGIRRIDTIQNFPKVMEALGFEAGQAGESVQLIMDRLDGLPTATQDVVAMTQAFADSTGDLDLATRAALGFNDMMLASGASVGEVTQAQGVLNRVLGKGSATVAQWQSLQSVMPAQLAAVARELGGEGMSVEELREALNEGEISWNDFLGAVVKLDTEGSGAVKSFRDQAIANSVGIGTAIQNIGNRIGAGWADILDSIGREDISGAINDFSYGIRDAMISVGDAIDWLKERIGETDIVQNAATVLQTLGEAISGLWNDGGPDILRGIADGLINLTDGALNWLADHGEVVTAAVWGIAGALAALAGWQIGAGLVALPGVLSGIGTALMANPFGLVVGAIAAVAAALYGFFTQTETGRAIWQGFCDLLATTWEGLKQDWANLTEVMTREWQSFQDFIGGIPEWWQGVKDGWVQKVEETKTEISEKWESIKREIFQKAMGIRDDVRAKVHELSESMRTAWENVRTTATQKWESIKLAIFQKAMALRDSARAKIHELREDASTTWENMKTTVTDRWNAIKTAIETPINAAKEAVRAAIDAIKGFFNFQISWPHIPLPHFSVSGSPNPLDWLTQGVPTIGIDWYAKGGVFDGATLIGVGEAGPEAVLPLNDRTMGDLAGLLANKMEAAPTILITGNNFNVRKESDIDAIAEALSRRTARQRGARL